MSQATSVRAPVRRSQIFHSPDLTIVALLDSMMPLFPEVVAHSDLLELMEDVVLGTGEGDVLGAVDGITRAVRNALPQYAGILPGFLPVFSAGVFTMTGDVLGGLRVGEIRLYGVPEGAPAERLGVGEYDVLAQNLRQELVPLGDEEWAERMRQHRLKANLPDGYQVLGKESYPGNWDAVALDVSDYQRVVIGTTALQGLHMTAPGLPEGLLPGTSAVLRP